jgi:1,4-dihydroxy-2-naphthoyl-CoA synthase
MAQTEKEMIEKITKYIFEKKGAHSEWFMGISSDPQKALFKNHNVDKKTDFWMYEFLPDAPSAHRVVDQLLMMGYDGDPGRKEPASTGVFVYRKKQHTKE